MEFRPLEINGISANDLKDVNLFTKMHVYVVVSINGDHRTSQKTPVDNECGSHPEWNYTMKFTIDEAAARQNLLNLVFRLKSDRQLGDKDIGTVQVPIKVLLDHNNGNEKIEQNVSYSVRLPNGKAQGILNFSYRFGEKFNKPVPQPPVPGAGAMDKHGEKPAMAYLPPPTGYPGPSSGHPPPPPGAYQPPSQMAGYPYPPPGAYPPYGYQQPPARGYPYPPYGYQQPPARGYPYPPPGGYPPYGYQQAPAPGYGYPGYPPQGGYGYPPVQKPQKPKKSGKGAGLGLGLAGALLGGILIGDMAGDSYEAGVEDGLDFDF